jgi:hypothetical protein
MHLHLAPGVCLNRGPLAMPVLLPLGGSGGERGGTEDVTPW